MKIKIHYKLIITFCIILVLQSCDDFLTVKPREKKIVSTITDYRDMMASFLLPVTTINPSSSLVSGSFKSAVTGNSSMPSFAGVGGVLAVFTGEVPLSVSKPYHDVDLGGAITSVGRKIATWQYQNWDVWTKNYAFIGNLNVVINGIENAIGNDLNMKNYIKGEALVWRAYSFYKLLQYYSPYNDNNLGIVIHLDPVTDVGTTKPKRKTQKESYQQIIEDCMNVLELLKVTPTNRWNFAYREDFVYAMLASVYSFKALSASAEDSDWDNAANFATLAIGNRKLINNSTDLVKLFDASPNGVSSAVGYKNDEFYIRIMGGDNTSSIFGAGNFAAIYTNRSAYGPGDGIVNSEYSDGYLISDIRKAVYFRSNKNSKYSLENITLSAGGAGSYGVIMPFRLAEMYLIKAEALCRKNRTEAFDVFEYFRKCRYTTLPNIPLTRDELLAEIIKERKLEFYQEIDMIWLDIKRLGITISKNIEGELYTLEPNDYRLSFIIPSSEMLRNDNMIQNPGWVLE